ncbi:MAG: cob(I)yrinic acid a,c-diamide adenosyltransferase [Alphaproteobacteria bacterium]
MVRLTKIYTRGGDKGMTSLGDGKRVAKHSLRVDAYGYVDEANATLGVARLHSANSHEQIDAILAAMQNDLFDVGADLCVPEQENYEYEPLRVTDAQVEKLEAHIDALNADLEPLNSFILPGGSALSAHLHICRTSVRTAERQVTALAETETINPAVVKYLNRASDLFFVLARVANDKGASDVLWVPGANRT